MKKFELKIYICTNFGIICLKFLPILVVPYVSKEVQKCSWWPSKQSKKTLFGQTQDSFSGSIHLPVAIVEGL